MPSEKSIELPILAGIPTEHEILPYSFYNRDTLAVARECPGKLCCALGIDIHDNGNPLEGGNIVLLDNEYRGEKEIIISTRIGIKKGADRPFRFYLSDNPYISG